MEYIIGKELLKRYRKHEIIDMMRKKQLTPYSPAQLKPYEIVHESWNSIWPENPLTDNFLPSNRHIENPYSKLYLYLDEVLFDAKEVNLQQSSEPKFLERREVAMLAAKRLKQKNKNMTLPEAIREINSDLLAVEHKPYNKKRLSMIIKPVGFLPGKRGPKVKK